jgi:hypothetical protein
MLSIGRLGVTGGAEYYLAKVANNVDDYYLGRGEAPGQWIGAMSERLGFVGQVDAEALRNLLAGKSATGADLGARLSSERRPGYDLTFSAPKGVSLLWAFGPGHVHDAISDAHDRAIGAVLDHLSAEACYARRGAGSHQLVEANGFTAAAFRHRTSRAGDPQLHTGREGERHARPGTRGEGDGAAGAAAGARSEGRKAKEGGHPSQPPGRAERAERASTLGGGQSRRAEENWLLGS